MGVLAVPMYSSDTFPKQTRNKNTTEKNVRKTYCEAIRVTIFAAEKQHVLHILSVCL
jgi:hypothetical protein